MGDTNRHDTKIGIAYKYLRTHLSNVSLDGHPSNISYKNTTYRIFSLYTECDNDKLFATIIRTNKRFDLTDKPSNFIKELRNIEIPRFITWELLMNSFENRPVIESYLGDDDVENLRKFSDPDLVKRSKVVCDHWSIIEKDHPKLIIEKDTEIDDLEDFRYLANKIRKYLNSTLKTKKYEEQFTEPDYNFI